jgi:hypothetical protein
VQLPFATLGKFSDAQQTELPENLLLGQTAVVPELLCKTEQEHWLLSLLNAQVGPHDVLHDVVDPSAGPASMPLQAVPHAFAMHAMRSLVAPSVPPALASAEHPV